VTLARLGAAVTSATPTTTTRTDQIARAQRQSPRARGSAPKGVVNAVGSVSPMRMPLLKAAVAIAIFRGNHSPTSDGNTGCANATPTPIRKVAPNNTGTLGPKPRSAPNTATKPNPVISAPRNPTLAINREPGTAAT